MPRHVFINFSNEDVDIATILKAELKDLATDCFLADVDLRAGQNFRIKLINEIESCSVVLALISQNYYKSEYANQELGIALGFNKQILPICLDDTLPRAFIDGIQCICCKDTGIDAKIVDIAMAIDTLDNWKQKNTDAYINFLSRSESWAEASKWAKEIQNTDKFTDVQIEQIGKAIIENYQVKTSWTARPILRAILLERKNTLSKATRTHLESIPYL